MKPILFVATLRDKVETYVNGEEGEYLAPSRLWLRAVYAFRVWLTSPNAADAWFEKRYHVSDFWTRRYDNDPDNDVRGGA